MAKDITNDIRGNVYGGGNQGEVTGGDTNVVMGKRNADKTP